MKKCFGGLLVSVAEDFGVLVSAAEGDSGFVEPV